MKIEIHCDERDAVNEITVEKYHILKDGSRHKISGYMEIGLPEGVSFSDEQIIAPIAGDTLKHLEINDGDALLVKINSKFKENILSVWRTPNGLTAKFAYFFGNSVLLHNKDSWKQKWKRDEVTKIGESVGVIKNFASLAARKQS